MEEEKNLVQKAKKGEREAFGELYKKYFQRIYRYCFFNTKNEEHAKDICQESFVKAWKKLSTFNTDGNWSFQAYLFAIARNQIIDDYRKKKDADISEFENLADTFDLYDDFERKNNIQKVRNILAKLNEEERNIIVLRYFEELPSQEVAEILGLKDGALRVRTHRIIEKVKILFEEQYGKRN